MKYLLLSLLAIYGLATQAAPERKPVVSSKQKFNVLEITGYNEIYQDLQAGVDSEFLSLSMFENLTKNSEAPVQLEKLNKCNQAENATKATSAEVVQLIRNDVARMAQHLQAYNVDPAELEAIVTEYDKMTAEFENLFAGSNLSTCEEQTFPQYTDGERSIVVRFNDRVLFMLQLTQLD